MHSISTKIRVALVMIGAILAASPLRAQNTPPVPPVEARQFDFWLGDWNVFTPDGKKAGENRIEKISAGWGLLENWTSAGGGDGKSLNTWRPQQRQWQQFWVGTGGALELTGRLDAAGRMVLTGRQTNGRGEPVINRITWTPNADGTVRQLWEQSKDEEQTWMTVFDGLYKRKAG